MKLAYNVKFFISNPIFLFSIMGIALLIIIICLILAYKEVNKK